MRPTDGISTRGSTARRTSTDRGITAGLLDLPARRKLVRLLDRRTGFRDVGFVGDRRAGVEGAECDPGARPFTGVRPCRSHTTGSGIGAKYLADAARAAVVGCLPG